MIIYRFLENSTRGLNRLHFSWKSLDCLILPPRTSACNFTIPYMQHNVTTACFLTKCPRISACNLIMPFRALNALRAFTRDASISQYQILQFSFTNTIKTHKDNSNLLKKVHLTTLTRKYSQSIRTVVKKLRLQFISQWNIISVKTVWWQWKWGWVDIWQENIRELISTLR